MSLWPRPQGLPDESPEHRSWLMSRIQGKNPTHATRAIIDASGGIPL